MNISRDNFFDDESKYIFDNRLEFSRTGNNKYIKNLIRQIPEYQLLISRFGNKPVYIFGAGKRGKFAAECYDLDFHGVADSDENRWGGELSNLPICGVDDIPRDAYILVTIANETDRKEVLTKLLEKGFTPHQIDNDYRIESYIESRTYFDLEYLNHEKDEVFIDGGTLDGETCRRFVRWCGYDYKRVYCFEPDPDNITLFRENMPSNDKISLITKGLWNKNGTLSFDNRGTASSRISEAGNVKIETSRLDDILQGEKVTFIKMDIEGAEKEALEGCKNTICKYKPKLAISVYHKPEDILEIPEILLSFRSDYKFWLRHYSLHAYDTVLYAV